MMILTAVMMVMAIIPTFANADYTPKTVSKLVADVDGRNPSTTGRIPLILIHGVHGTDTTTFTAIDGTTANEKTYFNNFINYFYSSGLKDRYQLYRFHYLSDQLSIKDMGQGLREWIDDFIQNKKIKDGKIVIVAHSMGGLVARSYMQEQQHTNGFYATQFGGERVEKLITLATPHHGSPAANEDARITLSGTWSATLDLLDEISWGVSGPSVTEVNRSDLRWDNYNAMPAYAATAEFNAWLSSLNSSLTYGEKIIAYYGNMINSEYEYIELCVYATKKP